LRTLIISSFAALSVAISFRPCGAAPSSSVLEALNDLRAQGCDGRTGVKSKLRANRKLDEAVELLSKGIRLHDAITRGDYRASRSESIHISKAPDDAAIARMLKREFCEEATDPDLRDTAILREGSDAWIIVASPFDPPAAKDAPAVNRRMLALVNEARAKPRRCGRTSHPAARPLKLRSALESAAKAHAQDMAKHGRMSHVGSDGSNVSQRVMRTHYEWQTVAENVAAGQSSPEAVLRSWLESPGHCTNLMGPQYTEMGVGYAVNLDHAEGIFWAQVFASPRNKADDELNRIRR
jgi:uncharacterized protein YkwD